MKFNVLQQWGSFSPNSNTVHKFVLSQTLTCFFTKVANELWVTTRKTSDADKKTDKEQDQWTPSKQRESVKGGADDDGHSLARVQEIIDFDSDLRWSRWVLRNGEMEIQLSPVFPNLPVVVKPEYQFKLIQGGSAEIYVRIPVWIQVKALSENDLRITELPSLQLSRTWFGSFLDGEICYWFKTTARRLLDEDIFKPHLCVCPIKVFNNSEEELEIDKLCLRTEQLSIYINDKSLWSDHMTIEYKGGNNFSDIIVSGKPPKEAKDAVLIGSPRNPVRKGFAQRTFRLINELQAKIG
jgi:hypothetical protein